MRLPAGDTDPQRAAETSWLVAYAMIRAGRLAEAMAQMTQRLARPGQSAWQTARLRAMHAMTRTRLVSMTGPSMSIGRVTDTTVLPTSTGAVAEYTDTWCWPAPRIRFHGTVATTVPPLAATTVRRRADPYGPVLDCMSAWLASHGLEPRRLAGPDGGTVALVCEIPGVAPGPLYVLDACLDTAPFGDEAVWTYPPLSGRIDRGWLHGRPGRAVSDSKRVIELIA